MKHNVDLTENMDFSSRNNRRISIKHINIKPWILTVDEDILTDYGDQETSLIKLGNKKIRDTIQDFKNFDDQKICIRCGRKINRRPWVKSDQVCKTCDNELSRYDKRYMW